MNDMATTNISPLFDKIPPNPNTPLPNPTHPKNSLSRLEMLLHGLVIRTRRLTAGVALNLAVARGDEAVLVVRHVLVAGVVLVGPGQQGVPVLADAGLAAGAGVAVAGFGGGQGEVVGGAHGVFAHVVDAVQGVPDIAGERAAMVGVV